MPVPGNSPRTYHFGGFSLDVSGRTLHKDGAVVHLTSRPFDVLAFLVGNSGRVVTEQELMQAVWRDTFVVEDNLTQAILKIRRTLGDETDHPQFVLTIPRVGYRFLGPVDSPDSPAPPAVPPGSGAPVRRAPGNTAAGSNRRVWAVAVGVVLLAAVVVISWLAGRSPRGGTAAVSGPLPEPMQLPLSAASATKPVFEADGLHFLYVGYQKERPGIGDIYRASLDSPDAVRITSDMDPRGDHPVLTPDGLGVVFTRWRSGDDGTRWPDLWQALLHGGPPHVLIEQASGRSAPSGSRFDGRPTEGGSRTRQAIRKARLATSGSRPTTWRRGAASQPNACSSTAWPGRRTAGTSSMAPTATRPSVSGRLPSTANLQWR